MDLILKVEPGDNPSLLHLGCGLKKHPKCFDGWEETRFDSNKACNPTICGDIRDINNYDLPTFNVIWFESALEHFCEGDINKILVDLKNYLKPGGLLYISVPNLLEIAHAILRGHLNEECFDNGLVRCNWVDVLYGHQDSVINDSSMSHRFGFTPATIKSKLKELGYYDIAVTELHELIHVNAYKGMTSIT